MKKLLKVLSVLVMVSLLTGCMKLNINVEVKADKSTKVAMEMLMEESMLKMSGMTTDDFIEQMKTEVANQEEMKDVKTEPVEKTIDGTKWVGVNFSATAPEGDETVEEKEIDGVKSLVLTLPMDEMKNEMDMSELEAYGYSVTKLKDLGMEMKVNITMPNEVTSNYGTVKDNTVSIDLLQLIADGKTDDIVVSSPVESPSSMTPILIGVAVVVIIGIAVLLKKKKAAPVEEVVSEETPVVEKTEETPVETEIPTEEKKEE